MTIAVNGEFIKEHAWLVKLIVNKLSANISKIIDRADLEQQGYLGLIKASKTYEPERRVKFEIYASCLIRGIILDFLKYQDIVIVPRRVREKKLQKRKNVELGKWVPDLKSEPALKVIEAKEEKELMISAIRKLHLRERKIIVLYYYSGFNMREIGRFMNLSQGRISQLHKQSIKKMSCFHDLKSFKKL